VRISRCLAGNGTKPESLRGVEGGAFNFPVVKDDAFRLAVFQEQFTVIGPLQRVVDNGLNAAAVQPGAGKKQLIGGGKVSHEIVLC